MLPLTKNTEYMYMVYRYYCSAASSTMRANSAKPWFTPFLPPPLSILLTVSRAILAQAKATLEHRSKWQQLQAVVCELTPKPMFEGQTPCLH